MKTSLSGSNLVRLFSVLIHSLPNSSSIMASVTSEGKPFERVYDLKASGKPCLSNSVTLSIPPPKVKRYISPLRVMQIPCTSLLVMQFLLPGTTVYRLKLIFSGDEKSDENIIIPLVVPRQIFPRLFCVTYRTCETTSMGKFFRWLR